jgi:outer membrane protein assembly factor BamA
MEIQKPLADPETPHRQIKIRKLLFKSTSPLPAAHSDIASEVMAAAVTMRAGASLAEQMQQVARKFWMDDGYLKAAVATPVITIIRDSPETLEVAVQIPIEPGPQFHLDKIVFSHIAQFDPVQLRTLVPLPEGEIFESGKVSNGVAAIRRAYAEQGFVNVAVIPSFVIEKDKQVVLLAIDVVEGRQFRVGKVEILGLNPQVAQKAIDASGLQPGTIFNPRLVKHFFATNSSILPADATVSRNVKYSLDENDGTVQIRMDFRR